MEYKKIELCLDTNTYGKLRIFKSTYPDKAFMLAEPVLFSEDLSIGSISPFDPEKRKQELLKYDVAMDKSKFVKNYNETIDTICNSDDIRIWTSNSPYEYIGTCFASHLLKGRMQEIKVCSSSLVETLYGYSSAYLSDDQIEYLADHTQTLNVDEYSNKWDRLVKEDKNLRIIIDHEPVSVSEDIFDEEIRDLLSNNVESPAITLSILDSYAEKYKGVINPCWVIWRKEVVRSLMNVQSRV